MRALVSFVLGVSAMVGCQAQVVPSEKAACQQFIAIANSHASAHPELKWSTGAVARGAPPTTTNDKADADALKAEEALKKAASSTICHAQIGHKTGGETTYLVMQLRTEATAIALEKSMKQAKHWHSVYRGGSKLFAIAGSKDKLQPEVVAAGQSAVDYVVPAKP